MRGKLGPILSGIGGFLLVVGVMLSVYAYPKLAVAPIDQNSTSKLSGSDATVFDIGTLSEINTDLTTTALTVGQIEDTKEQDDNVRIWVNTTSTKSADGVVRSRSVERVAFDDFSGEALDCCGAYSETTQGQPEEIKFEGQVFKFPFQTKQETYQWWDSTLRRAEPAEFVEEAELEGLKVYVFKQTIEPEVWTQMEVPPSVVGEEGEESVVADRAYGNTRTFWVEPETGVVIKRQEEQSATLQIDGEDRATLTSVTTSYTDETVKANVDEYGPKASQLKLVRSTLPWVLGVGGAVLALLGLVLGRRGKKAAKA